MRLLSSSLKLNTFGSKMHAASKKSCEALLWIAIFCDLQSVSSICKESLYTSQELNRGAEAIRVHSSASGTATPACMGPLNILTVSMDWSVYLRLVSLAGRASVARCLCRNLQLTRRSTSLSFLRRSLTLPIQSSESTTCHANIDLCTTAVYIRILNNTLKHISGGV